MIQTDNPDYWAYITRVVPVFFEFREQDGPWPDAPEGRSRREILRGAGASGFFAGSAIAATMSAGGGPSAGGIAARADLPQSRPLVRT